MILDAIKPKIKSASRNHADGHATRRSLTIERFIHPLGYVEPNTRTRHRPALDLFREMI
jgi:hypothetical protein